MNPLPNHCIECDTPTMGILCDECKEKNMESDNICKHGNTQTNECFDCNKEDMEDPMSNCCTAPFTEPGWPDSDICSKCKEHADIWEEEDG